MSPVYKLSNAGGFTSKQQYTSMLAGNTAYRPPFDFESIATVSVGSGGSSSVSFSSIPNTYTHLQLRYIAQDNRGTFADSEMKIQFNSDTTQNYSGHYVRGTGSVEAAWNGNETRLKQNCTSTAAGSNFAAGVIDILDYANTNKYKTVRILGGFDNNTSGGIWLRSGLWMSTSAISSIQIGSDLGTSLNQYSHFALYGIKGA